jgi:hypothetical protein
MDHPCKNCIVKACCNRKDQCEAYKKIQHITTTIIFPLSLLLGFIIVVCGFFIMMSTTDIECYKYYLGGSWLVPIIIGHYISKKFDVDSGTIFYLGPISVAFLLGLFLAETTRFIFIRE